MSKNAGIKKPTQYSELSAEEIEYDGSGMSAEKILSIVGLIASTAMIATSMGLIDSSIHMKIKYDGIMDDLGENQFGRATFGGRTWETLDYIEGGKMGGGIGLGVAGIGIMAGSLYHFINSSK